MLGHVGHCRRFYFLKNKDRGRRIKKLQKLKKRKDEEKCAFVRSW